MRLALLEDRCRPSGRRALRTEGSGSAGGGCLALWRWEGPCAELVGVGLGRAGWPAPCLRPSPLCVLCHR